MEALLTSTSTDPNSRIAASRMACTPAWVDTSAWTARLPTPCPWNSATAASASRAEVR